MTHSDDETKTYRKRESTDWKAVLVWIATAMAPAALAIAGWAHGLLWGHDTRLTTLEVQRSNTVQEFREHQERDIRIQDQIRETLRRMEDKIDTIRNRQ
jgi:TolA-binding protein